MSDEPFFRSFRSEPLSQDSGFLFLSPFCGGGSESYFKYPFITLYRLPPVYGIILDWEQDNFHYAIRYRKKRRCPRTASKFVKSLRH
jgi:hypothetical protein